MIESMALLLDVRTEEFVPAPVPRAVRHRAALIQRRSCYLLLHVGGPRQKDALIVDAAVVAVVLEVVDEKDVAGSGTERV